MHTKSGSLSNEKLIIFRDKNQDFFQRFDSENVRLNSVETLTGKGFQPSQMN